MFQVSEPAEAMKVAVDGYRAWLWVVTKSEVEPCTSQTCKCLRILVVVGQGLHSQAYVYIFDDSLSLSIYIYLRMHIHAYIGLD